MLKNIDNELHCYFRTINFINYEPCAQRVKLIDDYHLHSNMIFFKSDNAAILASIA